MISIKIWKQPHGHCLGTDRKTGAKRLSPKERRNIMKAKRILAAALGVITAVSLAACAQTAAPAAQEAPAEAAQEEAAAPAEEKGTITVAASPTPHAEILEEAAKILKEQGWTLEVTVMLYPNICSNDTIISWTPSFPKSNSKRAQA